MSDDFQIQSHIGPYQVHFVGDGPAHAAGIVSESVHFIVDSRVANLYATRLATVLAAPSILRIEADEHAKSLERMPDYVQHLVQRGFRRDHRLIAIGGGVTQDITCFLAATMMRGVDWLFYPTTLLAQADSCIGSKSSINVGETKNILGTFTPPREVFIDVGFLSTLDERDVRSGVGEILKVHAIDGPSSFRRIGADYERLFAEPTVMVDYIRQALLIKKPYIEEDEYDRESRQIFNYGHSFGHAIESATNFAIPHGIAVTMGMDMANFVAARIAVADETTYRTMHPTLAANYRGYADHPVPAESLFAALSKDKKNSGSGSVTLILPDKDSRPTRRRIAADDSFHDACREFLKSGREA